METATPIANGGMTIIGNGARHERTPAINERTDGMSMVENLQAARSIIRACDGNDPAAAAQLNAEAAATFPTMAEIAVIAEQVCIKLAKKLTADEVKQLAPEGAEFYRRVMETTP